MRSGRMHIYRPQSSCEGYVFTPVCDSVHRVCVCVLYQHALQVESQHALQGGVYVLSQHALQVVSQHALQEGGVCAIPACIAGGIPACLAAGGVCSRGVSALGVPAPGRYAWRPPPPKADAYCCGQYASYWNAFLLIV